MSRTSRASRGGFVYHVLNRGNGRSDVFHKDNDMVERSQDWEWSSLKPTARSGPEGLLCAGPVLKSAQWTRYVNGVETEAELKSLRHRLTRGTPFGETRWQTKTAAELGRASLLRPRGSPKRPGK